MQLIVMAHRGEAQTFIKNLDLKADKNLNGLYTADKLGVLITGEGIYNVFNKLPYVFGKHSIDKVINLGIAGALSSKLNLGEVYPIRTSYGFNEVSPKFHSFSSSHTEAEMDCITTDQRVLNNQYAKELNPFAHIVDRELWAIGNCCKEHNISFCAYKLISDFAGDNTACFDIKERAQEFSESLFEYYQSLNVSINNEDTIDIEYPLQMSFSNKARYKKVIQAIALRENKSHKKILCEIGLDHIVSQDIKTKNKVSLLINRLENKLNPLKEVIEKTLDKHFSSFTDIGVKINIDPKLEIQNFDLSMKINSQTNLSKLKDAIEDFDYSCIEKIWNGEFDV